MLKTLMTATAMAALLATGAVAADNNAAAPTAPAAAAPAAPATNMDLLTKGYKPMANDNLATHLIGAPVFASNDPNADQIGDINDLVVNKDGSIAAVVIGVGGFLGVGEKNVAVSFDNVQQIVGPDNNPRLVVNTTKDALNAAPAFQWDNNTQTAHAAPAAANNGMNPNPNGAAPADNTNMAANNAAAPANPAANAPAATDNTQMANNAAATANPNANGQAATDQTNVAANNPNASAVPAAPPYNSNQLTDITLTAQQLIGTNAYGPNDQHLGTIGDVVLGQDGKNVQAVVIDFGGFLGIGTKPVAVDIANLRVAQDQNGNKYVYINVTRDQLQQAVAFNADTFKDNRDQQLLQTQPLS